MKNRVKFFGILILLFGSSCTKEFTEERDSAKQPVTRSLSLTTTDYYWYCGEQIGINRAENKKFILLEASDQQALSYSSVAQFIEAPRKVILSSKIQPVNDHATAASATEELQWAVIASSASTHNLPKIVYDAPFFTTTDGKEVGLTHLFYVKLKQEADLSQLTAMAATNKVRIHGSNAYMPLWYTLSCDNDSSGNALEMANKFYESGKFESCQPDLMCDDDLYAVVNDPLYSSQWHLKNNTTSGVDIKFEQARLISQGSADIIVAVVDQGIQLNHPDLNVHSVSYDSESGTQPSILYGDHGTKCSGFISAKTNNGIGVASIVPNCKLMSVSNSLISSPDSRQKRADAINFACNNGASVITNSWGSGVKFQVIDDAIANALLNGRSGKGCVVVFASGNDHASSVAYPANCNPDILAVGAIGINGSRASFSNYGAKLDIVAPGQGVTTTNRNSSYVSGINGTSFACPIVAGVAALVLSINPELTQKEVANILESTAAKCGNYSYTTQTGYPNGIWNNQMGYGLVDAYAAAVAAQQMLYYQDLYLSGMTITDERTFSSYLKIFMEDVTVKAGGSLSLEAGQGIEIDQPFTVQSGASFNMEQTF